MASAFLVIRDQDAVGAGWLDRFYLTAAEAMTRAATDSALTAPRGRGRRGLWCAPRLLVRWHRRLHAGAAVHEHPATPAGRRRRPRATERLGRRAQPRRCGARRGPCRARPQLPLPRTPGCLSGGEFHARRARGRRFRTPASRPATRSTRRSRFAGRSYSDRAMSSTRSRSSSYSKQGGTAAGLHPIPANPTTPVLWVNPVSGDRIVLREAIGLYGAESNGGRLTATLPAHSIVDGAWIGQLMAT